MGRKTQVRTIKGKAQSETQVTDVKMLTQEGAGNTMNTF